MKKNAVKVDHKWASSPLMVYDKDTITFCGECGALRIVTPEMKKEQQKSVYP